MGHKEFHWRSDCFGCSDLFNSNLWRMALAEFIGTFIVIYVGLMCKVTTIEKFTPTIERQGFGWGFVVASMSLVVGHISGGHLNPVISVGLIFSGSSSIVRAILFCVMQISGGMYAGILFKYSIPWDHVGEFAVLWHDHAVEPLYGFLTEMFATVPLLLLCASLKDQNRVDFRGSGALAVGMYHVAAHQCFWYYTGACLNPVRALAPAFATDVWNHHWVYWAGPFAGAVLGGIIYGLGFKLDKEFLEEQKLKLIERQKTICPKSTKPPKPIAPVGPAKVEEVKEDPSSKKKKGGWLGGTEEEEEEEPASRKRKKKGKEEEPPPPPPVAQEEESGKKKKKKKKEEEEPPPPPAQEDEGGKKKKKKKKDDDY